MSKIRIGIDPGKESYLCFWSDITNAFTFYQFPISGKETDIAGIAKIFDKVDNLLLDQDTDDVHAVIEDVHAIYGSSASNTFEFGKMLGILEALLCAYKIPYTKVQPKVWQKEMFQGVELQQRKSSTGKTMVNDTKGMAEVAAKRLFPNMDLRNDSRKTDRAQKVDHNKVDVLLLTNYCKRKF